MRAAVALSFFALIAVCQAPPGQACSFVCRSTAYFAPSSGERIPPGATIYVFPGFDTNVVVRVIGDGRSIEVETDSVEAGATGAIAVSLGSLELDEVTVEVSRVSSGEEYPLGTATYEIDASIPEPANDLLIERVARGDSQAVCGLAVDHLFFEPDVRAHAYRFEWARSEQAYRDGDREVAIIKRLEHIDGNVLAVGDLVCGQNVIPGLSGKTTLFVGIAAVGYQQWWSYAVPAEPTRIDVSDLPNQSWEELFEHRLVENDNLEPIEDDVELMPKEDTVPAPSIGRVILGAALGLLVGWPLGLLVGRRVFRGEELTDVPTKRLLGLRNQLLACEESLDASDVQSDADLDSEVIRFKDDPQGSGAPCFQGRSIHER